MADNFPVPEGPLVGQKISSHAITEEYAKADPIFVQKTAALPKIYSHYRPILGDGNCGWRAIGFAYFESFLRLQSKAHLEEEMARISSLNNLLITSGGFKEWLFEDMVAETIGLLKDLAELVQVNPHEAECILMERFNNAIISNSIVYHFRLLASSWLKANPETYEGFILDGSGVDAYSQNYIEPVNVEIEHLIMCVLIDVLLKPIGIAVEIVYLDRTPGSQANTHIFQDEDPVGVPKNPGSPTIHLLFRPSHYDILYRDELMPLLPPTVPLTSTTIQANSAFIDHHYGEDNSVCEVGNFLFHTSIPSSFSYPSRSPKSFQYENIQSITNPLEQSRLSLVSPCTSPAQSVSSCTFSTNPTSGSCLRSPSIDIVSPTFSQFPFHSNHSPSQRTQYYSSPSTQPPRNSSSSFRPSKYEWVAASDWQESQLALQSPTFKNSHYNTAHFNNANFQPEQWMPDLDDNHSSKKK
ncbi:Ubiquitin thioesterase OTUB1 [Erysiphe neolycopersici]|uniref:ubiquitinyl hydrolase 1 n=1 Tax=Erysiphe neolycopersici TaxID=212602 RepID=A0A420HZC8_9PEZI|nr:Ubiquitin thioesterase OTUB1 [Erysiphe neolycopersici]